MSAIENKERRVFIYNFFSEFDKVFRDTSNDFRERVNLLGPLFQELISVPSPVNDSFLALDTTQKVWIQPNEVSDEELIVVANLIFLHALMTPMKARTKAFGEVLSKINHLIALRLLFIDLVWERYGEYGSSLHSGDDCSLLDGFFKRDERIEPFVWDTIIEYGLTAQIICWSESNRFRRRFYSLSDACDVIEKLLKGTPKIPIDHFFQILDRMNCPKLIGKGEEALRNICYIFDKSHSTEIISWLFTQKDFLGDEVSYPCVQEFFYFLKEHHLYEHIPIFFAQLHWSSEFMDMDFWLSTFLKKLEPSDCEVLFRQSSFLKFVATPTRLLKILRHAPLANKLEDFPNSIREFFARIDPLKIFDTRQKLLDLFNCMISTGFAEEKFNSTILTDCASNAFVFGTFCNSVTKSEDPSLDYHPV